MRINRYIYYLLVPVPVVVLAAYYLSFALTSYLGSLFIDKTDKKHIGVPDFELQEVKFDTKVVEALSHINLKPVFKEELEKKEPAGETLKKPPSYSLQFVFIGRKRYAIVNGKLFMEGEHISPDEKIVKITKRGVLLYGRWGKRWLYVVDQ